MSEQTFRVSLIGDMVDEIASKNPDGIHIECLDTDYAWMQITVEGHLHTFTIRGHVEYDGDWSTDE